MTEEQAKALEQVERKAFGYGNLTSIRVINDLDMFGSTAYSKADGSFVSVRLTNWQRSDGTVQPSYCRRICGDEEHIVSRLTGELFETRTQAFLAASQWIREDIDGRVKA